eukprot:NODE_53_length_30760_cov_1.203712.p11 type:complete len:349 gc:universal NODE_53_length_30760_cov_1.203712:9823-10869(+)
MKGHYMKSISPKLMSIESPDSFWERVLNSEPISNKKLKESARKGIPQEYRRKIWIKLGSNFSIPLKPNENILKCLGTKFPHIEYAPYLKNLIYVMRTILDPGETASLIGSMIMDDKLLVNSNYTQMINLAESMNKNGGNCERMMDSFFNDLSIELRCRLIDCLIVEGFKISVKFCLSALSFPELPDDLIFMKKVFSFSFSRKKLDSAKTSPYSPEIIGHDFPNDADLTEEDWLFIWKHIPQRDIQSHLNLCFSSNEHGYNISSLYRLLDDNSPFILFITTLDHEVFGVFVSSPVDFGQDCGNGDTLLFQIQPSHHCYKVNKDKSEIDKCFIANKKEIIVGSSKYILLI